MCVSLSICAIIQYYEVDSILPIPRYLVLQWPIKIGSYLSIYNLLKRHWLRLEVTKVYSFSKQFFLQSLLDTFWRYFQLILADVSLKVPPNCVSNEDHAKHFFKNEWTLVIQICFLELYEEANWSSYLAIQHNGEVNLFLFID